MSIRASGPNQLEGSVHSSSREWRKNLMDHCWRKVQNNELVSLGNEKFLLVRWNPKIYKSTSLKNLFNWESVNMHVREYQTDPNIYNRVRVESTRLPAYDFDVIYYVEICCAREAFACRQSMDHYRAFGFVGKSIFFSVSARRWAICSFLCMTHHNFMSSKMWEHMGGHLCVHSIPEFIRPRPLEIDHLLSWAVVH